MRRVAVSVACGIALSCAPPPAFALLQSCTVAATPVAFGTYDPSSATALAGTGTITVTCSVLLLGLLESWTLSLSTGGSGNFTSRQMTTGGQSLLYNLYTAPGHTQVWGNGSGGTGTVSDSQFLVVGSASYPYTVYGLVNALQDRAPGTYTDVITVTVNY